MQITTAEIASITGGRLYGRDDIIISDLITDSRNISLAGPATLFIVIEGERNDGHDFIPYLRKLGVRAFLVTDDSIVSEMEVSSDDAFILVEDSVQALQEIVLFERNKKKSLISWFRPHHFRDEAILIKGSRLFGFEEIGRLLEQQTHVTRLEINFVRVLENINYYRSFLKPGTKMMAMVKAFAYGVGLFDMADWLNYNGIDFLTVAFIDEGVDLRRAGVKGRIVVMSPDRGSFKLLLKFNLEPELFSTDMVRLFLNEAAINELVDYPVHIKFDTGMHRLGMDEDELPALTELLLNNSNVRVASVFSHLGSSERADHDHHTLRQAAIFERMARYLQDKLGYNFLRHLLNSTGIERFPQFQYDMVRIGIGLYTDHNGSSGVDEPSVRLRTEVIQVKKVKEGEGIGYGFTDISTQERTIAVIPVGYADGLPRIIGGGRGIVAVKGIRVPVTGNICMDMCMIDVTGHDVAVGDEVEIFGKTISLQEVADQWETITHNVLTGISRRVKRVFFY